jgi:hypothetical protein
VQSRSLVVLGGFGRMVGGCIAIVGVSEFGIGRDRDRFGEIAFDG